MSYNAGQFADIFSKNFFIVSENNIKNKNHSCKKLIQKNLKFNKLQKDFIKLNIPYKILKQESFYLNNCIKEDLILVDN